MPQKRPRVISLVPSWTETLIWAAVHVVGRTRFCIHPQQSVDSIPVLGGTKNIQMEKLITLKPDFVIMDKQENTLPMAEAISEAGFQIIATDVTSLTSLSADARTLGEKLESQRLIELAERYQNLDKIDPQLMLKNLCLRGDLSNWETKVSRAEYVIWKGPFMVVGKDTFIADNLQKLGIKLNHEAKYPTIADDELKNTWNLFSSEPFPFEKKMDELWAKGFDGILVDGEKLSWFGIRNLLFLEASQKVSP